MTRRELRGQATVELAALMPVVIVVALTTYNLARYVALCATFDRVSYDAVIAQGVAPSGTQTSIVAAGEVGRCIESALDTPTTCSVEVSAERVGMSGETRGLFLSPRCTLVFRPWPSTFTIAGVAYDSPLALRHERALVVDRYRPGVVI